MHPSFRLADQEAVPPPFQEHRAMLTMAVLVLIRFLDLYLPIRIIIQAPLLGQLTLLDKLLC